jgi:hypothetical protein
MFIKKLLPIFAAHFMVAYVMGSRIYGFHDEPSKLIAVGLFVIFTFLTYYARDNVFVSVTDSALQAIEGILVVGSGCIGYSRDYVVIAITFTMLTIAVLVCYVRVKMIARARGARVE